MTRAQALLSCVLCVPAVAGAQDARPFEIGASIAATRVFRVEDQSFGTGTGPGIDFGWRVSRSVTIGAEVNRVSGLSPDVVTCAGLVAASCSGRAREGVLTATILSVTAAWRLGAPGSVQPYILGGLDVLWSRNVSSVTFAGPDAATIVEQEASDRGVGPTVGVGVRIPVGARVVLRPEWRLYDGSLLGAANLAAMRTSFIVAYGF
jgi:hypothetical protein